MSHDGGWDLTGKTAVVTGATSGLGRLAALALAERGARLHLVCRDPAKAERVAGEVVERSGCSTGYGITANAVDPGRTTRTGFARELGPAERATMLVASPFLQSPRKGVRPIVHLCAAPEVAGVTGTFRQGMRERELGLAATDAAVARRLWQLSASLTGVDDA